MVITFFKYEKILLENEVNTEEIKAERQKRGRKRKRRKTERERKREREVSGWWKGGEETGSCVVMIIVAKTVSMARR